MKISYMQFLDDQLLLMENDQNDPIRYFHKFLEEVESSESISSAHKTTLNALATLLQLKRNRREIPEPHEDHKIMFEVLQSLIKEKGLRAPGVQELKKRVNVLHEPISWEEDAEEFLRPLKRPQQPGALH